MNKIFHLLLVLLTTAAFIACPFRYQCQREQYGCAD